MIPLITAAGRLLGIRPARRRRRRAGHGPVPQAGALGDQHRGMMVALGCLYASLDAPFLFVAQIIVYTGAVMMLFLFTMMIVGVDTTDSLIETIKGQRVAAGLFALALAGLLIVAVGQGIVAQTVGLEAANEGGNVQGVAEIIFGPFVFAFEVTAALLMVATLAAIVLAHGEKIKKRETQADRVRRRTKAFGSQGTDPGPLPSPGVYARHNSIEYPALLPDGSVAENSISPTLAIRGVAVVENDGLRTAHRTAMTQFVGVQDELDGTDRVGQITAELADADQRQITSGSESASEETQS